VARPKLEIKAREVQNYAKLGASNREIADMLGCAEATIRTRFKDEVIRGRAQMKLALRRRMERAAEKGNAAVLIFLAKNQLGMTNDGDPGAADSEKTIRVRRITRDPAAAGTDGAITPGGGGATTTNGNGSNGNGHPHAP
jgi:DNA-binding CsgD family transcriptional regulator